MSDEGISETVLKTPQRMQVTQNENQPPPSASSLVTFTSPATISSSTSNAASKLSAVVGDGTFESIMKARAIKRKEKDEHCVAELRVAMTSMDRNLTQEIKRRIESNKTVDEASRERIGEMEERLKKMLEDKIDNFHFRLSLLEDKVVELNDRLDEEKMIIPSDIEKRGKELQDMLASFQTEFSVERRDRLSREGRIMKQLTDHAGELTDKWEQETLERQKDAEELKARLEHHESHRAKADEDFDSLISSELMALKESLQAESSERKEEDDEIVAALNRYTENLQQSLSMLD
mmetsp:Transcript_11697/g.17091  ORF Transcript_11697/g.17091 Transcript_11697/m.17091 type:complete len:292 (-) Transcript_11697:194-1069(-)|eukprot:CAMPEP_0194075120 /NCGR_PEP_ID=MMETSP0149-20130528/2140_1 /TAXON_ID=122233 /ORGANISM="Chaetoceros debilis, Strain MM31A-1" /LENGTH=291 /DNA_ID=CAMNT_0038755479 /DNA_START=38 /DNA_END=913 /DNA_ORIENTATION=+